MALLNPIKKGVPTVLIGQVISPVQFSLQNYIGCVSLIFKQSV